MVGCLIAICDRVDIDTAAHVVGVGVAEGSREEEVASQKKSSAMLLGVLGCVWLHRNQFDV